MLKRIVALYKKLKQKYARMKNRYWAASDSVFIVYFDEQKVAQLCNAAYCDMFWYFYDLLPTTHNPALLEQLYSADFWLSEHIKIIGCQSKLTVQFLIASYHQVGQWQNEKGKIISIEQRPKTILLRGPYPMESP